MEVTKKEAQAESKEVKRPEIDSAIIEELLKGYERPTDLTGPGGIIEELHKRTLRTGAGGLMGRAKRPSKQKVSGKSNTKWKSPVI